MKKYNTFSDFEKQRMLKLVESECSRLKKSKYWVLQQLGLSKSTYYDWVKTGGVSRSKAPRKVWNKTPSWVEDLVIKIRDDTGLYQSERSFVGIANKLTNYGIFMSSVSVWNILSRHGKNRDFSDYGKVYIIYPKAEKFLDVVCIDDIHLTNWKPRDMAVFNAIDEYSQESVAISFLSHRVRQNDVIDLLKMIKNNCGKFPKTVRLDNAKAHISLKVKYYCLRNNIKLQFIDPGTPQQNWPVETFNGVIKKDLIKSNIWNWSNLGQAQKWLEEYREYYNTKKPLNSDPLKRTPREISTAMTSKITQMRLKYKLLRKHHGQIIALRAMMKEVDKKAIITTSCLSEMCVN